MNNINKLRTIAIDMGYEASFIYNEKAKISGVGINIQLKHNKHKTLKPFNPVKDAYQNDEMQEFYNIGTAPVKDGWVAYHYQEHTGMVLLQGEGKTKREAVVKCAFKVVEGRDGA